MDGESRYRGYRRLDRDSVQNKLSTSGFLRLPDIVDAQLNTLEAFLNTARILANDPVR